MFLAVDVQYQAGEAQVALGTSTSWEQAYFDEELVFCIPEPAPYVPGEFYRRELPCILEGLRRVTTPPHVIVVDSYVDLEGGHPGMGRRLYDHMDDRTVVVGVAKTRYKGSQAQEVSRHGTRPLFVTAAGMSAPTAANNVLRMHGSYRIPTLLKRVDRLARG